MSTELMVKQNQISLTLQSILDNIQLQIEENERNVSTNVSRMTNITNLITKMTTDLQNLNDRIDHEFNKIDLSMINIRFTGGRGPITRHLIDNGTLGQIGKLDPYNMWIFPHDECIRCLAYTTDEEESTILETEFLEQVCWDNNVEPAIYNIKRNKRYEVSHDYDLAHMHERASYIREYIPHRTWLVNPATHKVYFYYFPGKWIDFSARCDSNTGKVLVNGQYEDFKVRW